MDSGDLLPVGRRVAYWRGRRRLSQQMLADRLGKSKSWVDKVERGVRALDRVSTLHDIAAVLRIDAAVLLGRDARPAEATERTEGVERIRAALSAYEITLGRATQRPAVLADWLARQVGHGWVTYQHARYPQLVDLLPPLLADAQRTHARDPATGRGPLVEAYRITAALLVKVGEADLAWLATDRGGGRRDRRPGAGGRRRGATRPGAARVRPGAGGEVGGAGRRVPDRPGRPRRRYAAGAVAVRGAAGPGGPGRRPPR
ncbi:helix-turn-helix domain-containing protein [Micromonospora sp. NBRC 110038]|uniref:helix-turn-helix domain-containing protein n=1 Tax=Micromonospora sp. NBRC 110038 TaxID=1550034 RepID=UPI001E5A37D8|nr:helix-turn-helix domain-containing protein [Micromonospora sp. NBRC 110038]